MVLSAMFSTVVLNTMSFLAYWKGFASKSVDVDEFTWSYLERESVKLIASESESTDTMVFLHGFSSMKESWLGLASGVDRKHRVLIPDLPGQGRTTPADALLSFSADHQARRLHAFLEKTVPADRQVHLAGVSMGGMIAGVFAAKYPERVASLTMLCPAGISMTNRSEGLRILEDTGKNLLLAHSAEDIQQMLKLVSHNGRDVPYIVASIIGNERGKQIEVLTKIVTDCLTEPTVLEQFLPQIRAKTLVLWGKQDRVLDVSCLEKLQELLATVDTKHVLVFDECGHTVQFEKAEQCAIAINQFLNDEEPTGTLAP